MSEWNEPIPIPDYHHEITLKERSSRYIRTAFDYFRREKGEKAFENFLDSIRLDPTSSIFEHIYNDRNWNSYLLEVFIYSRLSNLFEDPVRACYEFGIASGSGRLDQKQTLFTRLTTIVPTKKLMKKIQDAASQVSLISTVYTKNFRVEKIHGMEWDSTDVYFDFDKLPVRYEKPHWSTIAAGYGIVEGVIRYRKGLPVRLKITHWPVLPSDMPMFDGKKYMQQGNEILEQETQQVVANIDQGAFELNGVFFNYGRTSIAHILWKPESFLASVKRFIFESRKQSKALQEEEMRSRIMAELNEEHQKQLSKYKAELQEKNDIIRQKMEEIKKLKIQQDGDYFLTSLLTSPYLVNDNKNMDVQTEFIVRQKKQFRFRNRRAQLGGDLCLTSEVTLQGRSYTFFVNCDAMGKSMQGAGGALVFGSVVQTFLKRSHFSKHQQSKDPKRWLADLYLELQNAFVTFDGTMLASAIFGLVDSVDNKLYFVNAEHPYAILYRDSSASFIDNEIYIHKLGVDLNTTSDIHIHEFSLKPGDIIIIGSDGKDDIAFKSEDGNRIINEDETMILDVVQQTKANLRDMVLALRRRGRITDDISLLRIAYKVSPVPEEKKKEEPKRQETQEKINLYDQAVQAYKEEKQDEAIQLLKEVISQDPNHHKARILLGGLLEKQGHHHEAIEVLKELPESEFSEKALYVLLKAYKRIKNYSEALNVAEELALRKPSEFRYIWQLADLYRLVGDKQNASIVLERLKEEFGNHPKIDELEKVLA
ncbi:MAG: hypothetical protein D6767_10675 [Candidatus Hydrogenedentota bacterium]|nr:MAG: hypothetical protein D6767_10675 [Candidatus Hydrogenedentota bacterium]